MLAQPALGMAVDKRRLARVDPCPHHRGQVVGDDAAAAGARVEEEAGRDPEPLREQARAVRMKFGLVEGGLRTEDVDP